MDIQINAVSGLLFLKKCDKGPLQNNKQRIYDKKYLFAAFKDEWIISLSVWTLLNVILRTSFAILEYNYVQTYITGTRCNKKKQKRRPKIV